MATHTDKSYEAELTGLRDLLLEMGGAVERALATAVRAVTERDSALAEQVKAKDLAGEPIDAILTRAPGDGNANRHSLGDTLPQRLPLTLFCGIVEYILDVGQKSFDLIRKRQAAFQDAAAQPLEIRTLNACRDT